MSVLEPYSPPMPDDTAPHDPAPEAAAPVSAPSFSLPIPLERSHRILPLFNNIQYEFETLEFVGPEGEPLVVVEESRDRRGKLTQTKPIEWFAMGILNDITEFYKHFNSDATVLFHLTRGGKDQWLAGVDIKSPQWAPGDEVKVQSVVEQAKAAGVPPQVALQSAIQAGQIHPPVGMRTIARRLVEVSAAELNQLFANHEEPKPEPPRIIGFAQSALNPADLPKLPAKTPLRMTPGLGDGGFGFAA